MKNTDRLSNSMHTSLLILLAIVSLFNFTLLSCTEKSDSTGPLPRSTPEAEGLASSAVLDFLDAVDSSGIELHSFMVLRHGKVLAEGYWAPYQPDLKNILYSVSKSFTSTAIGLAVSDSLLDVHDKVISFFPDYLPDSVSPNLADMEIQDLLCMAAGQSPDPTYIVRHSDDWIRTFLSIPVNNEPGTVFQYSSAASFMLSAILTRVTGESVLDYLKPRLFDPLGIKNPDWETDPEGNSTGGWGLRVRTEDMAKFGQLYLQKGQWNGQQLIPESWVEEATNVKIMQNPGLSAAERAGSDWEQGYCYKFWRSRHNSYRADGAYGQFILVLPDLDAVIVMTAEAFDLQKELNLPWDELLPGFSNESLQGDPDTDQKLAGRLAGLAVDIPQSEDGADYTGMVNGHAFVFTTDNSELLEGFSFECNDSLYRVTRTTSEGKSYSFDFGKGYFARGESPYRGPYILPQPKEDSIWGKLYAVAGAYNWTVDSSLTLTLRFLESPHSEYYTFNLSGETPVLESWDSRSGRSNHLLAKGRIVY